MNITPISTVLLVEDEAPLQAAITIKLKQQGYAVLNASSSVEALAILAKEKPDLIWLDMLLPGTDGLQFLKELREHDDYKTIPVIMVSVMNNQEKIKQAFELNIVDFIVKSQYRLEEIIGRIGEFFEEKSRKVIA